MPSRLLHFKLSPWEGGLNTSLDPALIPPQQCTTLDNVVFGERSSRKKRDGIDHSWDYGTITGNTAANPTVISSTAHGLATNDQVVITGSNSTPTIDGTYTVTVTGANTFTIPVNVSNAGTAGKWRLNNGSTSILKLHDFWYDSSGKTQLVLGVASDRSVYKYSAGARTKLTDTGTAWSGTLTSVSAITFNNRAIIACSGSGNVVKMYDGTTLTDLSGTPPQASIVQTHLGRIWTNDKTNPDRIHYSPVADHTQWNGAGDSGAFDIGKGDGDPEGITAIFPSFKGELFVAKKTKLYRISGLYPETFEVRLVSSGIGCVSHNAVAAIDQDDIFFVSEKGVHSLAATANYGDFEASYVSLDIQKTFNEDLDQSRLKYIQAAYLPNLNSVAFGVTEETSSGRSLTTTAVNNTLYLYNIYKKAWYRWPDLPCSSVSVVSDSDRKRFYFGTHNTRVSKSFNSTNYDVSKSGSNLPIRFKIVSGLIYPDNDPYTVKKLRKFVLYYRPQGTHTITAQVKVDSKTVSTANLLSFSDTGGADLLGSTFILGTSVLGYDVNLGAYTRTVDGRGRGFRVTIEQTGTDESADIQGIGLIFEPAGASSETNA